MSPSDSQGLDICRLVKTFDGLMAVDGVSFQKAEDFIRSQSLKK